MKIPTAVRTNSSMQATCAPTTNDQMPPNFIVPPVLVIPNFLLDGRAGGIQCRQQARRQSDFSLRRAME